MIDSPTSAHLVQFACLRSGVEESRGVFLSKPLPIEAEGRLISGVLDDRKEYDSPLRKKEKAYCQPVSSKGILAEGKVSLKNLCDLRGKLPNHQAVSTERKVSPKKAKPLRGIP